MRTEVLFQFGFALRLGDIKFLPMQLCRDVNSTCHERGTKKKMILLFITSVKNTPMVDLQIYHEKASLYQYFSCCINIPLIFFNLFRVGRERRLGEHPKLTKNNLQ